MGSLSTLCSSFANPVIRTEQPAAKKTKQSLFGQGVVGMRYCGGVRLVSTAAVGPPCSHRQSSPIGGFSLLLLFAYFLKGGARQRQGKNSNLCPLPEVPGVPILGNLLQLKEKKPHKTFAKWAETYGPVYSIKTSASTLVVLNSVEVAKELPKALDILTSSKCMVAMSDYNEFHKMVKRCILNNVLGPSAQKRLRGNCDNLVENISKLLYDFLKGHPSEPVNFRRYFENELFPQSLKQALGEGVDSVYVEELGATLSKDEIFKVLVLDMMLGAIEVDWRYFFPYLQWVYNKAWEDKINQLAFCWKAVNKALIREQTKAISAGKNWDSYTDFLLREAKTLSKDQITILAWETIIESTDTTLVTTELALYELAKNPLKQERLYQEIQKVCGSQKVTEDHISEIPYLGAVFLETLRKHLPVPVVPWRYAHEDTELGGFFVPAGSQIAINIYGCNTDKNRYENPLEWFPERFLDREYKEADMFKTMAFLGGKRVCHFEWRLNEWGGRQRGYFQSDDPQASSCARDAEISKIARGSEGSAGGSRQVKPNSDDPKV